jgi:hypothetical protein
MTNYIKSLISYLFANRASYPCAANQSTRFTEITASCDTSHTEGEVLKVHPVTNMQVFIIDPGDIHSKPLGFK